MKALMLILLMASLTQAMAARITTTLKKNDNIRYQVSANIQGFQNDHFYLKVLRELPQGTVLSFDYNSVLKHALYQAGSGEIKRTSSFYYGPLQVISAPGLSYWAIKKLNRSRFYVHKNSVDSMPIARAKFDRPVPWGNYYGQSVEWDKVSTKGYFSWAAKKSLDNLGNDLLSTYLSDVTDFCPNYNNLHNEDKKHFWITLMSSISKRESNFDPSVTNDESKFQKDLQVISRGLMQISFGSVQNDFYRNRGCNPRRAEDLADAQVQFDCAVAIFSHLANQGGCIDCKKRVDGKLKTQGIAKYWSTLRSPYTLTCDHCSSGQVTVGKKNEIIAETRSIPACRGW